MTEWKEIENQKVSEVFECLGKGGEAETRAAADPYWRQLKIDSFGNLVFRYHCMGLHLCATRQWRVRKTESQWKDCTITGAMSCLWGGYRVQAAYDDEWHDVLLDSFGNVRYESTNLLVPINAGYKWRYRGKE